MVNRTGSITPEMVALLARCAGFEFTPERCELLTPQLEWLLAQGELLAGMDLGGEEPALVFHSETAVSLAGGEQKHGSA